MTMLKMNLENCRTDIASALAASLPPVKRAEWASFFDGVFCKWVFNALEAGGAPVIDKTTLCVLRPERLVDERDLAYFREKYEVDARMTYGKRRVPLTLPALDKTVLEADIRDRCTAPVDQVDDICSRVLNFYYAIGGRNNFLSVPPGIVPNAIELFGSPLNAGPRYCSALVLEKQWFGSLGSAFDYEIKDGDVVIVNPPFDEAISLRAVFTVLAQLGKVRATAYFILPNWKDFEAAQQLEGRGECGLMDRFVFPFYSYRGDCYVPASNTRLTRVGPDSLGPSIYEFAQKWTSLAAAKGYRTRKTRR